MLAPVISLVSSLVIAGVSLFSSKSVREKVTSITTGDKGTVSQNDVPVGFVRFQNQMNEYYIWPQAKYEVWKQIQEYAAHILLSEDWNSWRSLNSFRRLTNGGKIDAVMDQVGRNSDLFRRGWGYGIPGGFSYKDFAYPGIDINRLGAGSENFFQRWFSDITPAEIFNKIKKMLIDGVKTAVDIAKAIV